MTITADYALLAAIIEELSKHGSWCGETHIQKTAYAAKQVLGVPLEASFILYKHGPYSFDVNATLASMRADRMLSLVPKGKYGPSYSLEEPASRSVRTRFLTIVEANAEKIHRVAAEFASKNVAELERVATAIYVTEKSPDAPVAARAAELNRLKPHIDLNSALAAVHEADRLRTSSSGPIASR
jgi:uncharacterized protein YwgA